MNMAKIAKTTDDLGSANVIGQKAYGKFGTAENHSGEFMPYRWDRKTGKFYDPSGIEVTPPDGWSYTADENGDPKDLIHPIDLQKLGVTVVRLNTDDTHK